jgi:hemoglobin
MREAQGAERYSLSMLEDAARGSTSHEGTTLYDRVGGEGFFRGLVERFYVAVEDDPVVRRLYPTDLEPGKTNLAAFLAQYFGGPQEYTMRRGHPRLRMRHARFAIGARERAHWLKHMTDAVHASEVSSTDKEELIEYFESASRMLVNQFERFG